MSDLKPEEVLNFDAMYLGFGGDGVGSQHIQTQDDLRAEREQQEDNALLLSNEAETFCILVVIHGLLPSDAFEQSFSKENEFGLLIKPDLPAYQSRILLRQPEVKARIEEIRAEIREWGKTTLEEVEMNYRRIALDPHAKPSDRIAATKGLCNLRGFDAQPENLPGMQINIQLPFTPNQLTSHRVIEHEAGG